MRMRRVGRLLMGCLVAGSMAFGSAQALTTSVQPELLANGCERCINCPFLSGGKYDWLTDMCVYCCQVP
jgi:hypothetical protein